jgi:vacuolar iron transporter family protein
VLSVAGLAAAMLFAVGATIGKLDGRPVLRSGPRQVVVGALVAGVAYRAGDLIGASAC